MVNQVLYHVASRGIEYDLLPWMRSHQVTLMAYCPLAQAGRLQRGLWSHPLLTELAAKRHVTVPQLLLAWAVRDGHTIAIPRTGKARHTLENSAAASCGSPLKNWPRSIRSFPLLALTNLWTCNKTATGETDFSASPVLFMAQNDTCSYSSRLPPHSPEISESVPYNRLPN